MCLSGCCWLFLKREPYFWLFHGGAARSIATLWLWLWLWPCLRLQLSHKYEEAHRRHSPQCHLLHCVAFRLRLLGQRTLELDVFKTKLELAQQRHSPQFLLLHSVLRTYVACFARLWRARLSLNSVLLNLLMIEIWYFVFTVGLTKRLDKIKDLTVE